MSAPVSVAVIEFLNYEEHGELGSRLALCAPCSEKASALCWPGVLKRLSPPDRSECAWCRLGIGAELAKLPVVTAQVKRIADALTQIARFLDSWDSRDGRLDVRMSKARRDDTDQQDRTIP